MKSKKQKRLTALYRKADKTVYSMVREDYTTKEDFKADLLANGLRPVAILSDADIAAVKDRWSKKHESLLIRYQPYFREFREYVGKNL